MNGLQRTACFAKGMNNYAFSLSHKPNTDVWLNSPKLLTWGVGQDTDEQTYLELAAQVIALTRCDGRTCRQTVEGTDGWTVEGTDGLTMCHSSTHIFPNWDQKSRVEGTETQASSIQDAKLTVVFYDIGIIYYKNSIQEQQLCQMVQWI